MLENKRDLGALMHGSIKEASQIDSVVKMVLGTLAPSERISDTKVGTS